MTDPHSLVSTYFLHRLGLTSDELYWPSDSSTAALGTVEPRGGEGIPIDQDVNEAWRIRDVITEILKENGISCDFNDEGVGDGEGGDKDAGGVISISSILDAISPSEDKVQEFASNNDSSLDLYSGDKDAYSGNALNISAVHKAFSAGAYSILRGYKRSLLHQDDDGAASLPITNAAKITYEPPLLRAMESIAASRIDSLNEASGKSVAPFLKKNNTIPWFHVPIVDQRVASGVKDAPPSIKPAKVKKAQPAPERNKEDVLEKAKEEWGHASKKPMKRSAESSVDNPAEKKMKLDHKEQSNKPPPKVAKLESPKVTKAPFTNNAQPMKMDHRANVSRAILCAASAVVFRGCTPDYDNSSEGSDINPQQMPLHLIEVEQAKRIASKKKKDVDISLEAVMGQATIIAERALDRMHGAARRNDARTEFRKSVGRERVTRGFDLFQRRLTALGGKTWRVAPGHSLPLVIPNPFGMEENQQWTDGEGMDTEEELLIDGPLVLRGEDAEWSEGLMRMLKVLRMGSGNVILHDLQWKDRAFRVAELLRNMAVPISSPSGDGIRANYGPHLIVASGQDLDAFAKVFGRLGHGLRVVQSADVETATTPKNAVLRALSYNGSKERRRRLRKHFGSLSPSPDSPFCFLGGQRDSPYHVILTTYSAFAEDYTHFCQIPFQAVVIDDGMSWLGCSHADPNSKLGKVWDTGLWSSADHGAGIAGVLSGGAYYWDFSKDDGGIGSDRGSKSTKSPTRRDSTSSVQGEKSNRGKLLVGLTARHRILVASKMHATCNGHVYKAPISSLLTFLAPHFMEIVRDDWDRSKMSQCERSMSYIRKLIARSVVVYSGTSKGSCTNDLFSLSVKSLNAGVYPSSLSLPNISAGSHVGEVAKSNSLQRKDAMAWFRPGSALPKELNDALLDSLLATIKSSNSMGFVCEEIVPASTLTTSGANGAVTGPAAYRTAVRCGRPFSNEQSLKQHIAAFHAPAGTWLCRSCGVDCVTSQARAHHERSCSVLDDTQDMLVSAANANLPPKDNRRGPKKKEAKNLAAAKVKKDNFVLVSGFRGIYLMPNGKHCIKIDGKVITDNSNESSENDTPLSFDSAEAAAKRHDQILKDGGNIKESEMNYGADGSRIVHAKETSIDGTLEGGTSNNVIVPALAVINIKDLPKDVKPLLRDPNQTSRTGGNSKRYVYAYRGVCRQARKGHDRWQAQISFNGCNHYLGTFDSEWDAAAVYAWAHLILYGEEATKKAQQEGEEAAAAYEQLQKDIAAGKVPPPAPSPPKKKKNPPGAPKGVPRGRKKKEATPAVASVPVVSKKESNQVEKVKAYASEKLAVTKVEKKETNAQRIVEAPIESRSVEKESTYTSMYSKKHVPTTLAEWMKLKTGCAMMLSSGTKGTSKATLLASKKNLASMSNSNLLDNVAGHSTSGSTSFLKSIISFGERFKSFPSCIALSTFAPSLLPQNGALLIGLSAAKFSWDPEEFISTCRSSGASYAVECRGRLTKEYGRVGSNVSFRSLLLSCPCIIGQATKESQKIYSAVRIKETQGMSVGSVGCNVAGPNHSCSEAAAKIEMCPTQHGRFQFLACNDDDIVTLNGKRIQSSMGPFPLRNNDVCSIGPRVFAFVCCYNTQNQDE